jgi:hypothetical protein
VVPKAQGQGNFAPYAHLHSMVSLWRIPGNSNRDSVGVGQKRRSEKRSGGDLEVDYQDRPNRDITMSPEGGVPCTLDVCLGYGVLESIESGLGIGITRTSHTLRSLFAFPNA